jgi:hypothetical protein
MDTDAMIDAAFAAPEAVPVANANTPQEATETIEEGTQEAPADSQEQTEETKEAWPKKAENALAREKGKAARLKFERDQERARVRELEQRLSQSSPLPKPVAPNDGAPKESDFQSYADYLEARSDWKLEQKLVERDGKQQQSAQYDAWVNQRSSAADVQAAELAKTAPDAFDVMADHEDTISDFSPQLKGLLLEADNTALAIYNLAKEGKLESLGNMSLAKAAMEIGRAQTQAPTKPQTKAPAPLPASRGSVAASKPLERMSPDELRKWMRSS